MKRGDLVLVALPGDYGKSRPAVIVQADSLEGADSTLVALISTYPTQAPLFRLGIDPTPENGLHARSNVLVEKIYAVPRVKLKGPIGTLSDVDLLALNRMLAFVLSLSEPGEPSSS